MKSETKKFSYFRLRENTFKQKKKQNFLKNFQFFSLNLNHLAEDFKRLAHRRLNMQTLHILPALLQQTDQEINGHIQILSNLFGFHFNGSNSCSQAQDLLELELNNLLNFGDLALNLFGFSQSEREFTDLNQDISY